MNNTAGANLIFTDDELNFLKSESFFKIKREILNKLIESLNKIQEDLIPLINRYADDLPSEALATKGKISKGDNYKGLPYLVLDYPRVFKSDNVFAFRTIFWWANYFSLTIHISGIYFSRLKPVLPALLSKLRENDFYVCVNSNEWEHDFGTENYAALEQQLSEESLLNNLVGKPFLKLARKVKLNEYHNLRVEAIKTYSIFLRAANECTKHQ